MSYRATPGLHIGRQAAWGAEHQAADEDTAKGSAEADRIAMPGWRALLAAAASWTIESQEDGDAQRPAREDEPIDDDPLSREGQRSARQSISIPPVSRRSAVP
jgi:hypothetical protein